jgi:hypothetical protein
MFSVTLCCHPLDFQSLCRIFWEIRGVLEDGSKILKIFEEFQSSAAMFIIFFVDFHVFYFLLQSFIHFSEFCVTLETISILYEIADIRTGFTNVR